MEIIPGAGVPLVKIGDHREHVEGRIGGPVHGPGGRKAVYDTTPGVVVGYTRENIVEVVEIGYSGAGGEEAFLQGVQLTFRFLDDVVAELTAKGFTSTPSDIGFEFHAGFAVWSMGSRTAQDLDPDAAEDDERAIAEGVTVAPYALLAQG